MRTAEQNEKGAVHALTLYSVVQNAGRKAAWVALKPETGRTHQLRFHVAEIRLCHHRRPRSTPVIANCRKASPTACTCTPAPCASPDLAGPIEIVADLPPHMKQTFAVLGFEEHSAENFFDLRKPRRIR